MEPIYLGLCKKNILVCVCQGLQYNRKLHITFCTFLFTVYNLTKRTDASLYYWPAVLEILLNRSKEELILFIYNTKIS